MTYNDNDGLIWMGDWPWIEVCCSPPSSGRFPFANHVEGCRRNCQIRRFVKRWSSGHAVIAIESCCGVVLMVG